MPMMTPLLTDEVVELVYGEAVDADDDPYVGHATHVADPDHGRDNERRGDQPQREIAGPPADLFGGPRGRRAGMHDIRPESRALPALVYVARYGLLLRRRGIQLTFSCPGP
jgi:hypothetical protein